MLGALAFTGELQVIVTYDKSFTDRDINEVRRGGRKVRKHKGIRGFSAKLSAQEVYDLLDDPRIQSISPDRVVVGQMDIAVETSSRATSTRIVKILLFVVSFIANPLSCFWRPRRRFFCRSGGYSLIPAIGSRLFVEWW